MRKTRLIIALILALLLLSACGSAPAAQTDPSAPDSVEKARPEGMDSVLPGANQTKPERAEQSAEASEAPSSADSEQYKIAYRLIGAELADLIDKIGEPLSADYSASCLGSGEDGELKYEGFTVYTYKDGEREIIQDVIK